MIRNYINVKIGTPCNAVKEAKVGIWYHYVKIEASIKMLLTKLIFSCEAVLIWLCWQRYLYITAIIIVTSSCLRINHNDPDIDVSKLTKKIDLAKGVYYKTKTNNCEIKETSQ